MAHHPAAGLVDKCIPPGDLWTAMNRELHASGWEWTGIQHGFGERDQPVGRDFHLVRAKQVHGIATLTVDTSSPSRVGEADALITATPGVAVAIGTADCVPLLLVAPKSRLVVAVHAGWRGTLAGISRVVLDELRHAHGVRAEEVRVALGPAIGGCCFEIETELAERFAAELGSGIWSAWRGGRPGKGYLDLRQVNRLVLRAAGVAEQSIQEVGPCTACSDGRFASYRVQRAADSRQLSWIGLE